MHNVSGNPWFSAVGVYPKQCSSYVRLYSLFGASRKKILVLFCCSAEKRVLKRNHLTKYSRIIMEVNENSECGIRHLRASREECARHLLTHWHTRQHQSTLVKVSSPHLIATTSLLSHKRTSPHTHTHLFSNCVRTFILCITSVSGIGQKILTHYYYYYNNTLVMWCCITSVCLVQQTTTTTTTMKLLLTLTDTYTDTYTDIYISFS